jgi:hypothetical protein
MSFFFCENETMSFSATERKKNQEWGPGANGFVHDKPLSIPRV